MEGRESLPGSRVDLCLSLSSQAICEDLAINEMFTNSCPGASPKWRDDSRNRLSFPQVWQGSGFRLKFHLHNQSNCGMVIPMRPEGVA